MKSSSVQNKSQYLCQHFPLGMIYKGWKSQVMERTAARQHKEWPDKSGRQLSAISRRGIGLIDSCLCPTGRHQRTIKNNQLLSPPHLSLPLLKTGRVISSAAGYYNHSASFSLDLFHFNIIARFNIIHKIHNLKNKVASFTSFSLHFI